MRTAGQCSLSCRVFMHNLFLRMWGCPPAAITPGQAVALGGRGPRYPLLFLRTSSYPLLSLTRALRFPLALPLLFLSFLLFYSSRCTAQDSSSVARIIPMNARLIAADELGNVYAVRGDNTLTRYNEAGDSTGFYRSILNGRIETIDVTNPLNVILYYPAFSKAVILDRMMNSKTELDLRQINIYSGTAVAYSADGNIWIYDPFNAVLRKIDEQLRDVSRSNDLRQQLPFVPYASYMTERGRRLYVCDTAHGILVFDQFATYINTIPILGLRRISVVGQQLIWRRADTLVSYNLQDFEQRELLLPASGTLPVRDAALGRNLLYVLYSDRLVLYRRQPLLKP